MKNIKRVLFCSFLSLLCTTLLMAKGVTQAGKTYLYDYKTKTKRPIANVKLTVADAEPTFSGADGTFTLKFTGREMGDKIAHSQLPYYQGMKVFNKTEFENWFIRKEPLRLIMCNKDEFDEVKERYYELGRASVKKLYDEKLAALKKEADDYYQRVQELEEERERIMDDLRNSADAMARLDQSDLDDQMRQVFTLYEQGEVDKAMNMLDDLHLEDKWLQTLERKQYHEQEAEAARHDSIIVLNNLRSSIDLYKNNGEWGKAAIALKMIADKLGTFDEIFVYAKYSQIQKNFQEAELYYQKVLSIARKQTTANPQTYEPYVAATLNNLANLYSDTQRFTESETTYKEAWEIYRRLVQVNPQAYEPYVAGTLNNLALLYSATQRFTESETMYKEALETYRRLAQVNHQAYEPSVAQVLNNLANLYYYTQRFSESETLYKETLEIRRRLAQENHQAYEPDVAGTLNDLAVLYYDTQRITESETLYKEAQEIRRRLAQVNPQTYEPDVARTLNNLALLYSDTQRFTESETMYKEALEICRRLAQVNHQTYEPYVARTLYNIGLTKVKLERYQEAIEPFEEAVEIYRRLAKVNPAQQQWYESSLYWLSQLYSALKQYKEVYRVNQEWLPIFRKAFETDKDGMRKDYTETLCNQSFCALFMKQYVEAEQLAREGLEVDTTLHLINTNLAAALLFQGRYAEAETLYRHYKNELKEGFLDDFRRFAEAGVIPKEREADVEKIKKMLNKE